VYGKVTQNNIKVAILSYAVKVWYWISLLNFWCAFRSLCVSYDTLLKVMSQRVACGM